MATVKTEQGEAELLVARTWFVTGAGGSRRVVRKGTIVAANDPLVKKYGQLFDKAAAKTDGPQA